MWHDSRESLMRTAAQTAPARRLAPGILTACVLVAASCTDDRHPATAPGGPPLARMATSASAFPTVQLPPGYQIEKVVGGLTYPSSMAWDDDGHLYVVESGSGLTPQQLAPPRILRVESGSATEVVSLDGKVTNAVVGIVWHKGAFYITHRSTADRTDAVSRVTLDGGVTELFHGIVDGQAEHQINDIRVGPDGRMYVTAGLAANAAVMSNELAGFIRMTPEAHSTACRDIVLTGRNFQTPDFRTPDPADSALTGAFVPYGTATTPGQVIEGREKCGGSILAFDPNNAEATLRMHAWGFRNIIGIAWDRETGEMYAANNGYDIRGSRPVQDEWDGTYRVREGTWYGVPDFSAALEPLTAPKFEPPDSLQAPVFISGEPQGRTLGFVIDHAASGLTPADPSLIAGLTPFQASPSMLDVAPAGWGDLKGDLFVADFGDLRPATNPLRTDRVGFRVARIDPITRQVEDFVRNKQPGPASEQGALGQGIERPFDAEFGPDGALYVVDYGQVIVDPSRAAMGMAPYIEVPGTGAIWKVSRVETRTYEVTIENLTRSQPFSPGVIVTHAPAVTVFRPGLKASEGIRRIAEDGDPSAAVGELTAAAGVTAVVNTAEPIHRIGGPGPTSRTYTIEARTGDRLSFAVMAICTNDGFTGLHGIVLPSGSSARSYQTVTYDAGTEANDELFSHIVDPCGAIGPVSAPPDGNARVPANDVIGYHRHIRNVGDLASARHNWIEPTARVTVRRVR
jgi:glucose/arabinose dehydrogenase